MTLNRTFTLVIAALLATGCGYTPAANAENDKASAAPVMENFAGAYLSSYFAQSQNDWKRATLLMDPILAQDPENKELIRRAMILAAGSGYHDIAAKRAVKLLELEPDDGLAHLILITHNIARDKYDEALKYLAAMPKGDMADFVTPLMEGWTLAGKGQYKPELFEGTTIHAFHGALIALFLKKDKQQVYNFAQMILAPSGLTTEEIERAADLMAAAGKDNDALNIYKALAAQNGGSDMMAEKIALLESKGDIAKLIPAFAIKKPSEGVGLAILDLARILYREESDASARIFAQMALDLNPALNEARILIASSYARSGQVDQAIEEYSKIPQDYPGHVNIQYACAELLFSADRTAEATALLEKLYDNGRNPAAKVLLGDHYRSREDYRKAIEIYNEVAATLPNPIPAEQWNLLYSRGMVYERLGEWAKAEADLQLALKYQPDDPYIMNYLSYGWIEKGIKLNESLEMLKKASALRPNDGYITDSLGWANYKMGKYAEAVPHLERAVELMPYDPILNDHLGDSYWQVGRKAEARFQWQRARSYAKDISMSSQIDAKLANGIAISTPAVREAQSAVDTTVPTVKQ